MPGAVQTIVVGVDESAGAAIGLRWAVREACLDDAQVAAVMAWGFPDQHHTIAGERFDPGYGEDDALDALRTFVAEAVGDDAATVDARVCAIYPRARCWTPPLAPICWWWARAGLAGFVGFFSARSASTACITPRRRSRSFVTLRRVLASIRNASWSASTDPTRHSGDFGGRSRSPGPATPRSR